jgi:hypothetical protein
LRPAIVAHDIWLASGLETVLPETVLLCLARSSAIDVLRERGIDVFCLSEEIGAQAVAGMSSADLLTHPATRGFCLRCGPLAVSTFKPSERLARAAAAVGILVAERSAPMAVARAFENKLAFVDIASKAGLRTPRWEVVNDPGSVHFADLVSRLGNNLVVQGARGNAGQRTWMVHSDTEWDRVVGVEAGGPLRVAEYVAGEPYTATGLAEAVTPDWRRWVEPCRQVTAVEWLTPMALGSCGNAWGDAAIGLARDDTLDAMRLVGGALEAAGYAGMFGVDFVLGAEGPVVIEANPRMVASLPLATQLEAATGRTPVMLQFLIAGLDRPELLARVEAADPALPRASQLIVHRLAGDGERPEVTSGVYRLQDNAAPEFLRPGAWWSDLAADDEALVLVREAAEPVTDGKEFARIYFQGAEGERRTGIREAVEMLRGT